MNCSGNGVCVDGVNSFNCQCVSGFTGELCSNVGKFRSDVFFIPACIIFILKLQCPKAMTKH